MLRVLQAVLASRAPSRTKTATPTPRRSSRQTSDEAYILDLCDTFLGRAAARQYGFDFLRGDAGRNGLGRMLPVDAWYADLRLVIEYRERQHSEAVPFFDRRETVSGVGRGAQRRLYDQRRRDVLPHHGIALVEFDAFEFNYTSNRRLVRCDDDKRVIAGKLKRFAA